jgi:hypothetical protein
LIENQCMLKTFLSKEGIPKLREGNLMIQFKLRII